MTSKIKNVKAAPKKGGAQVGRKSDSTRNRERKWRKRNLKRVKLQKYPYYMGVYIDGREKGCTPKITQMI